MVARGLLAGQIGALGSKLVAQLADEHSRAAARLAELIDFERNLEQDDEGDSWAEDVLAALDRVAVMTDTEPNSEEIRAQVLGKDADLALSNRRLVEEIAAVRYSLRRVLAFAVEIDGLAEYVYLVEIYGNGCSRLVRLLKREGRDQDRLADNMRETLHATIMDLMREYGWR